MFIILEGEFKNEKTGAEVNLALFDFDGTITTGDTFTKFVVSCTSRRRLLLGGILILPAFILYKIGWLSAPRMRPLVSAVAFAGMKEKRVTDYAKEYVNECLPSMIRSEILAKIIEHKKHGDRVIVVSASLSPYLNIWCQNLGIEVICSELESRNGRLTGAYLNGDCSGDRKVINVKNKLDLSTYENITAYGDTEEDFPMLEIADIRFYRGKPF